MNQKAVYRPIIWVEQEDAILRDSQRVIEHFHNSDHAAMIRVALAPCSPFSVSPDLMRESAILARQYQVGLHTHLAGNARRCRLFAREIFLHTRRICRETGLGGGGCLARPLRVP